MKLMLLLLLLQNLSFSEEQCPKELKKYYKELNLTATKLAGSNQDINQRVDIYKKIFLDPSHHGQFHFPLIAAHGAKWLESMIPEYNKKIKNALASSWVLFNREKQTRRRARASGVFIGQLLNTNQKVFVDTYSLYYFIKEYQDNSKAKYCLQELWPQSKDQVNDYFDSVRKMFQKSSISKAKLRQYYKTALIFEQESMVSDRVTLAFNIYRKKWRLGSILAKSPSVQFSYFPKNTVFYFSDFSKTDERVKYALRSYDIAIDYSSSLQKVYDALSYYP
ncbi:hypothetical protein N9N67_09945 [Bacteriovoracaceae bacterium]|nr:hypothetical protein [Bacteriovoracaceae bacterium]